MIDYRRIPLPEAEAGFFWGGLCRTNGARALIIFRLRTAPRVWKHGTYRTHGLDEHTYSSNPCLLSSSYNVQSTRIFPIFFPKFHTYLVWNAVVTGLPSHASCGSIPRSHASVAGMSITMVLSVISKLCLTPLP